MATPEKSPTFVVSGKVRLSYAHLFMPHAVKPGHKEKYSVTILIKKSDKYTMDKVTKALEAAKEMFKKTHEGKLPPPSKFDVCVRDGDADSDDPNYKDCFYIACKSESQPPVVDTGLNIILDKTKVYSGCYARVSFNLYPYDREGKGIASGLSSVQFLEDGEPFGSTANPNADFAEEWDDSMAAKPAAPVAATTSKPAAPVDEDDPEA